MQFTLLILACGITTILAQKTLPQCKCSALNPCEDAEFKKGQECGKKAECLALLGGDAAKVAACLDARAKRDAAMRSCMQSTVSVLGCKDSDTPAQIAAPPAGGPQGGGQGPANDPSSKYFECVGKCTGSDNCYKSLGCALDFTKEHEGKVNTARQSCLAKNGGGNPDELDCKCLAAAGVQVKCA